MLFAIKIMFKQLIAQFTAFAFVNGIDIGTPYPEGANALAEAKGLADLN